MKLLSKERGMSVYALVSHLVRSTDYFYTSKDKHQVAKLQGNSSWSVSMLSL